MNKIKVFITYEYFSPAYKAGGPIQSLRNMIDVLHNDTFDFYVYCSDKDMGNKILSGVLPDEWVTFNNSTKIFYRSEKQDQTVEAIIAAIEPDVIFINGLFSQPFSIQPLRAKVRGRKILSARGMLHPGALSQKRFKKKLFLTGFRLLRLHKQCSFHATTQEEAGFIKETFGKDAKVWVVPNLPKVITAQPVLHKMPGRLKIVCVALISPMKNIKLVIAALKECKNQITFDIYGPVKDAEYWDECAELIKTTPANVTVNYKGPVPPEDILDVLGNYHAFIMPSKSENFGHAIYEALSSGKPVITSHFTPWNDLQKSSAGFNVDVASIPTITKAIESLAAMDNDAYALASASTVKYAKERINIKEIKQAYVAMFNDNR